MNTDTNTNTSTPTPLAEQAQRPQQPPAFANFDFTETDVITLYGALQTYHQTLAARDDLPQVERVIGLMKAIRPAAVEATKFFQAQAQ